MSKLQTSALALSLAFAGLLAAAPVQAQERLVINS